MFSIYRANSIKAILFVSELLLSLSQFFKSDRAFQILFLEFNKDGHTDNRNKFIDDKSIQPSSGTPLMCKFLKNPTVGVLWPALNLLLKAS